MDRLTEIVKQIPEVNRELEVKIRAHLDNLTKPRGSLGVLEDIATQFCMIFDTLEPGLGKKRVYTFGGDHGVVDEGVSCFPREVTPQMVMNMLGGGAAINVLTRHAGAELRVVDIGVDYDFADDAGLLKRKVRRGTGNIARGPAMTVEEAVEAVLVGVDQAFEAYDEGVKILGTGEMGIGNTTPSSALLAALLPCDIEEVTGRGTGIDDETLMHKISVIRKALEVNREHLTDPLTTLAAVGGLEIAGICGLCLGAACKRIPVVVDGFISSAGALVACRMNPRVRDYMFFSHLSKERGHQVFVDRFCVRPLLDLNLRLGEGTGAALAMNLIEASVKIFNEMATFGGAGVSKETE